VLDRLVNLFNWRIAAKQLLGLSDEWSRLFGKWRVTQEIADKAVDICRKEWERVPVNVTREFEKILSQAMTVVASKNKTMAPIKSHYWADELTDAGAQICKRIKAKHPDATWPEVSQMLSSHKISVRKENPKASEIEILRMVWGMV
jgi:hypothetical protein